jgi:energy-coupling factor transport system permease protein
MKIRRFVHSLHPAAKALFFCAFACHLLTADSWWMLGAETALAGFLLWRAIRLRPSTAFLAWASLPFILLYTFVSSWFAAPGDHIWWQGPHVPWLGTLAISEESVLGALFRAVRLWGLLSLFAALGAVVSVEDVAAWFGRRYSRVGLTVAMVVRLIPTLLEQRARIAEIVRMRAAVSQSSPWSARLRAQAVVYQALMANALERSWRMAESMYVRGYGPLRRTLYTTARWRPLDAVLSAASTVLIGGAVARAMNVSVFLSPAVQAAWLLLLAAMAGEVGVRFRGRH